VLHNASGREKCDFFHVLDSTFFCLGSAYCGSASNRQIATTAKCVLPLTHVDCFKSLRTLLTLIKTMQPRRANVICVRLRTHKLTRRPRTVSDNDKAASPNLREHSLCMGNAVNMQARTGHVALAAAGVIDTGS